MKRRHKVLLTAKEWQSQVPSRRQRSREAARRIDKGTQHGMI